MINIYTRNIIWFFIVVLLQVLIMDNIQFSGYINPFFYVIFILLLPFEIPNWLLLLVAFILGFSIDLMTGGSGMHASASVFMAFLRPFILKNISPHEGYETGTAPRVYHYGIEWFAKYTFFLVLAHSIFLFYVESFSFIDFFHTMIRVILSTIVTVTIIILSQFFIFRK
jgi:rod shape-determining protein MreD